MTRTGALLLCALCALCEGFDIQAAGVAAAGMRRELHLTPGQLGWLFSAGGAGLLGGALAGGRLADRIGRKAVLVWSILLFGLFSLLTASAWDVTSMTAARLLTGLGLGGALPNLIALAADVSEASSRNTKVGITYIGMPLGAVVASFIALYVPSESWRTIFRAGGVAPLVIAPLVIFWMPRPAAIREKLVPPLRTLFAEGRAPVTLLLWSAFIFVVLSLHLLLNWLPLLMTGRGLTNAQASAMLLVTGGGPVQVLLGLLPIAVLCSACVGALGWRRASASSLAASRRID